MIKHRKGIKMISTLYAILTDESMREADVVEAQLIQQESAGSPWFNEE